jgi:hypothetical protein
MKGRQGPSCLPKILPWQIVARRRAEKRAFQPALWESSTHTQHKAPIQRCLGAPRQPSHKGGD